MCVSSSTDVQQQKDKVRADIEAKGLPIEEEERLIDEAFAKLNEELLPSDANNKPIDTRVGRLAWHCIFGCDAEPRAARTAKMNMIMHGDGMAAFITTTASSTLTAFFGPLHVVITNPPFGSNVGNDQKVGGSEETRVPTDQAYIRRCEERYGAQWRQSHDAMQKAMNTPILDLFQIGKGKKNRATEIVFVERCLNLLKPGGRMGIVLPDGNLNNPSLTWLRRWCEGKARILAVVGLSEETFSSAKATAKASLVFLRRFTGPDEAAWEAAWTKAHDDHDDNFDAQRDALCAGLGRCVVIGESAAEAILDELAKLGVERTAPDWSPGVPPDYPRGIGGTKLDKPRWTGTATDAKKAAQLKRDYTVAFDQDTQKRSDALWRELKAGVRSIDEAHNAALWATVREAFESLFVAAPRSVGITSTGETGETVPNELPALLEAYRAFKTWIAAGAKPEDTPGFLLPSAA